MKSSVKGLMVLSLMLLPGRLMAAGVDVNVAKLAHDTSETMQSVNRINSSIQGFPSVGETPYGSGGGASEDVGYITRQKMAQDVYGQIEGVKNRIDQGNIRFNTLFKTVTDKSSLSTISLALSRLDKVKVYYGKVTAGRLVHAAGVERLEGFSNVTDQASQRKAKSWLDSMIAQLQTTCDSGPVKWKDLIAQLNAY